MVDSTKCNFILSSKIFSFFHLFFDIFPFIYTKKLNHTREYSVESSQQMFRKREND